MPGKGTKKKVDAEAAEASAAAAAAAAAASAASAASEASAAASEASAAAEAEGGAVAPVVPALRLSLGVANYVKPSNLLQGFGTNFRVPALAVPAPAPLERLRSASPTRLGSQITRYLNLESDAETNAIMLCGILDELELMNLGIPSPYNKLVLDHDVFRVPVALGIDEVDARFGTTQETFPSDKGGKPLTGIILFTDTKSVAYVKDGKTWFTANPKVGVLQEHIMSTPGWKTLAGSTFALCVYSLVPSSRKLRVGELIFSGANHIAASAAGGGAGSAADSAVVPVETSHVDSLCNLLCFAGGVKECFLSTALQQIQAEFSKKEGIPIFYRTFEFLLSNVYNPYLQGSMKAYVDKEAQLVGFISQGSTKMQQVRTLLQQLTGVKQLYSQKRGPLGTHYQETSISKPIDATILQVEGLLRQQGISIDDVDVRDKQTHATMIEEKLVQDLTVTGQQLEQMQRSLRNHQGSRPAIEAKVLSIRSLQSGGQQRSQNIFAEYTMRQRQVGPFNQVFDPLGGLSLERERVQAAFNPGLPAEQIKVVQALKFLSAMYIRYSLFSRKPLKQLTSAQRVNSSWGAFNTRVALKGSKKPSRYRRGNPNAETRRAKEKKKRENATRRKREKRQINAIQRLMKKRAEKENVQKKLNQMAPVSFNNS